MKLQHCARMSFFVSVFALTCLLATTQPSSASLIVHYEFEGVVTTLTGTTGLFGASQVGDPFSGHFSYEIGPSNPDQLPADPELGFYNAINFVVDNAPFSLTLHGIGITHKPGLPTLAPLPPDPGTDSFVLVAFTPDNIPVRLRLKSPFDQVFTDDSLPHDLVLSSFTDTRSLDGLRAAGIFPVPSLIDIGELTSLTRVPEPSTMLALAVLMLVAQRRRFGCQGEK